MKTRFSIFLIAISVIGLKCEMFDKSVPDGNPGLKEYPINDTIPIGYKEEVKIKPDGMVISFDSLLQDSRCPANANCIWAGTAEVELSINITGNTQQVKLHTYPQNDNFIIVDNYYVELVSVFPYPDLDTTVKINDYEILLLVHDLNDIAWTDGIVVDKTGMDGCGLMIKTSEGMLLDPRITSDDFVLSDGMQLTFRYLVQNDWSSICMAGEIIKIIQVQGLTGCVPIIYDLDSLDTNLPGDRFEINSYEIIGDCLNMSVSYSGGCRQHQFKMIRGYDRCGTPPVPPPMFFITHDANQDMCEAYLTQKISFDLTSLQEQGGNSTEFTIVANEGDFNETLEYFY